MVEFTTPTGYIVRLKRHYLTYGEKLELQKLYLSNSKVDPTNQKIIDFNSTVVFQANEMVFKYLVQEIQTPEGKIVSEDLYNFVLSLPEKDGESIFQELNKYTLPSQQMEKKSN